MDIAAEKLITELITERRPDDGLLGEEGASARGHHGRPLGDRPAGRHGQLPLRTACVVREHRGGAGRRGGRRRRRHRPARRAGARGARQGRVPQRPRPLGASCAADGPGAGRHRLRLPPRRRARQAEVVAALLPSLRDIRRGGSAAVDLCDVAAGRLDGYYERGLNPWDYSAGALIAAEAGANQVLAGRKAHVVEPYGIRILAIVAVHLKRDVRVIPVPAVLRVEVLVNLADIVVEGDADVVHLSIDPLNLPGGWCRAFDVTCGQGTEVVTHVRRSGFQMSRGSL